MKTLPTLLLAVCAGFAMPAAAAADSTYDLFIVACDNVACKRIAEQRVSSGLADIATSNRNGLRLLIETLTQGMNEEHARVSLSVRSTEDGAGTSRAAPISLAQRMEAVVVRCTLKRGAFRPLTSFVSDGTIYQVWGRLAAIN